MHAITSSATFGIEAIPVTVETDISNGMNQFTIVGLPDASVKEARDRIRAAFKHSGFVFPRGRITINLAPAHIRKQGPVYDLPIALSILVSCGEIPESSLSDAIILGELALDGSVRSAKGVLTSALMARHLKKRTIYVPKENEQEAIIMHELDVYGVTSLRLLVEHLLGHTLLSKGTDTQNEFDEYQENNCFSFIKGQHLAKRGLEIAAAGGHNLLFSGPPGTGKTLLAKSLPSILPTLSEEESIEVTNIASIAGVLSETTHLIKTRPFRMPHHSSSAVSLVGGGSFPTPGEISLAHRGVLFLDELPEFPRHVLEHLRGPLEDGFVTISRAQATVKFPAQFLFIASMNPCPCGFASDPKKTCVCSPFQKAQYNKRLSGPLLDRIDLRIEVSNVPPEYLLHETNSESSFVVRERVIKARKIQTDRFINTSVRLNAEIPQNSMDTYCKISDEATSLLSQFIESHSLSPRATMRIQKVARTIADLAVSETIEIQHLAEAMQFREQKSNCF